MLYVWPVMKTVVLFVATGILILTAIWLTNQGNNEKE